MLIDTIYVCVPIGLTIVQAIFRIEWASCLFLNHFSSLPSRFNSCNRALELHQKHMSSPIDVFLIDLSTTSLRPTPPPFVSICGLCHNCANYNHHIGMDVCIPRTIHLFVEYCFLVGKRFFFEPCFCHFLTLIDNILLIFISFFIMFSCYSQDQNITCECTFFST